MKLNYLKMLEDVCELVETDFCTEMEGKCLPGQREITQAEAREMARLLARVYLIAHSIHCTSCGHKYEIKE